MAGSLDHTPAHVVRKLLVDKGMGAEPVDASTVWPVFAVGEPNKPDSAITVYNTQAVDHGRDGVIGDRQEHHGVQVRIRSASATPGYSKARAIAVLMDSGILRETVVLGPSQYFVQCMIRKGDVIDLGKDTPTTKRNLYTVNALVSIRQRG